MKILSHPPTSFSEKQCLRNIIIFFGFRPFIFFIYYLTNICKGTTVFPKRSFQINIVIIFICTTFCNFKHSSVNLSFTLDSQISHLVVFTSHVTFFWENIGPKFCIFSFHIKFENSGLNYKTLPL